MTRPAWIALAPIALIAGCEPYRIEYHEVPGYYYQASAKEIPESVTLEDGTVLVYRPKDVSSPMMESAAAEGKAFLMREELPDGTIMLRSILPEHVMAHTITCLLDEEYRLYFDQMLSKRAKGTYADETLALAEFEAFCRRNRRDLLVALHRMLSGLTGRDTVLENLGDGVLRCRLRPLAARGFKFKNLDMVSERGQLKLLLIH